MLGLDVSPWRTLTDPLSKGIIEALLSGWITTGLLYLYVLVKKQLGRKGPLLISLVCVAVAAAILKWALVEERKMAQAGHYRPAAFAILARAPVGLEGAQTTGVEVSIDSSGSSFHALILPASGVGGAASIHPRYMSTSGPPEAIELAKIRSLEFKRRLAPTTSPSTDNLWAIDRLPGAQDTRPQLGLAMIARGDFQIVHVVGDKHWDVTSESILNVRVPDAARLNGIAVRDNRIWLLGYDGTLYLYERKSSGDQLWEPGDTAAVAYIATVGNLNDYLQRPRIDSSVAVSQSRMGWQSLDVVERPLMQGPHRDSSDVILLANNSEAGWVYAFALKLRDDNGWRRAVCVGVPYSGRGLPGTGYDEGACIWSRHRDSMEPEYYLLIADAYNNKVCMWREADLASMSKPRVELNRGAVDELTLPRPVAVGVKPQYLEGVAVDQAHGGDLYVSDRRGGVYMLPRFFSYASQRTDVEKGDWRYVDLGNVLTHAQDLDVDDDRVWVADERTFRAVSTKLFSDKYQVLMRIRTASQKLWFSLLGLAVLLGTSLLWAWRRELREGRAAASRT